MAAIRMFVTNKSSLSAGDIVIKDRLELSHTVTLVDTSDAVSISGSDLFVGCSGSFSDWSARDYSGQNIPMVNLARHSWELFGYSTGAATAIGSAVTTLRPYGTAHPVHDGHPVGTDLTVMSSSTTQWRYPTSPPAGLDERWRLTTNAGAVIFTVEAGTSLLASKTALKRECGWGFTADTELTKLNAAGLSIFDEMVTWALDGSGGGTPLAVPTGWTFVKTSGLRTVTGSWSAVSGASTYDYQVERWTGSAWVTFATGNTASLTFSLTNTDGVDWSTQYRARVRAVPA
jgi:hypothetical protein